MKVKKIYLIFITGLIWLLASFLLLHRAYTWIELLTDKQLLFSVILSIGIAAVKTYLIFHKLTVKNIERVLNFKNESVSILKFHAIKDQILIVLMIVGGSLLRHTPAVPKSILMPVYIGIGLAMSYSSYLYMRFFIKNLRIKE